jgi:hypothetical protein
MDRPYYWPGDNSENDSRPPCYSEGAHILICAPCVRPAQQLPSRRIGFHLPAWPFPVLSTLCGLLAAPARRLLAE